MKTREWIISSILLIGIVLFPALWALSIDWIQSDERVVGENHPYYEDVVNRPAKQIYALYTSQHNEDGTHKALPYVSSGDLTSYMLKSTYDADADSRADTAEVLTDGTNINSAVAVRSHLDNTSIHISIITSESAPDIATNTAAFWVDTYTGQYWLILDSNGTQKMEELTTGGI